MINYKNIEQASDLKRQIQDVENAICYFKNGMSVNAKFPFNVNTILNSLLDKRDNLKTDFMDKFGIDIDYDENDTLPNIAQRPPIPQDHIDKEV